LGFAQGLLEFGGEFVETHGLCPPSWTELEEVNARFQDRAPVDD